MGSHKGYDRLAGVYDALVRCVFGKSIHAAQTRFLGSIPPGAHVLVLGGGTGWILEEIHKARPCCRVCYVEASAAMVRRAQKHPGARHLQTQFVVGTQNDLGTTPIYDVVVTHFFLDVFATKSLPAVMGKISQVLRPGGIWLFADFQPTPWLWQKLLVRAMYLFFRATTRIEGRKLPDWSAVFAEAGYRRASFAEFFHGMVVSAIFRPRATDGHGAPRTP